MKKALKDNISTLLILIFLSIYCLIFNNTSGWVVFFFMAPLLLSCIVLNLNKPKYVLASNSISTYTNKNIELTLDKVSPNSNSLLKLSSSLNVGTIRLNSSNYSEEESEVKLVYKHTLVRGNYPLSKLKVHQSDLLSLIRRRVIDFKEVSISVYPSFIEEIDFDLLSFLKKTMVTQNYYPEHVDLQLRDFVEYEHGMPIKNIHWKALAKSKDIMVKVYDNKQESKPSLTFYPLDSENFEYALSVFYTLAFHNETPFGTFEFLEQSIDLELDKSIFLYIKPQTNPTFTPHKNSLLVTPKYIDSYGTDIIQLVAKNNEITIYEGNQILLQIEMPLRRNDYE